MTSDYVITFHDGVRLRSLHPRVLSETDRSLMERLIKRQVERLAKMENGLPRVPESFPEAMAHEQMENGYPRTSDASLSSSAFFDFRNRTNRTNRAYAARASGYSGDVCVLCHGLRLRRTGTCVTCEDCGDNTGCG